MSVQLQKQRVLIKGAMIVSKDIERRTASTADILIEDGFQVFPYTTEDLVVADKLVSLGCEVLMPWGAPIGSGMGLNNVFGLRALRAHFPEIPLVIDAGLGLPSQAAQAWHGRHPAEYRSR